MNITSLFPLSFRPKFVRARVCSVPVFYAHYIAVSYSYGITLYPDLGVFSISMLRHILTSSMWKFVAHFEQGT